MSNLFSKVIALYFISKTLLFFCINLIKLRMRIFLKIGLPWACSLGIVFFIGLKLGKKDAISPLSSPLLPQIESTTLEEREISNIATGLIPQNQTTKQNSSNTVNSPPLPPNLIRIMKGGGILERMGSYLDALRSMDSSNVQDVVGAFEALPAGYGRHLEMKLLMRSWSAIDPESALNYALKKLDEKSERRFGVSEALAGWATQDPDSALEWAMVNNQKNAPEDNPYILGIIKGVAENDLNAANRRLLAMPSGNAKWQSATFLAQEYAKKSTAEAIAWANQFPTHDPRLRETILGQIGARVARQDLLATANWVENMAPEPASKRIMDNLLTQWVSQSPEDASNWVSEMEDREHQQYAMQQLTSRWSLVDPVSTAKWLNSFPPSPSLDPVVGEFVNRISGRDPEGAAGWALSIMDPGARQKAINKVMNTWSKVDPERSKAWLQENQTTP